MSGQQNPAIEAGMSPDEAIAAMMKQCETRWFTQCNAESLIQWLSAQRDAPNIALYDEETRQALLTQLRKQLSSPVTEHEAALLSGIGFGTYSVEQVVRRIRLESGLLDDDRGALDLNSLPP
ncbi:MAG: hypothetical protein JNL62_17810, partial [Bryobacterales bacterium]|nr:hypothetical protein [Bryobacterales bacterium]